MIRKNNTYIVGLVHTMMRRGGTEIGISPIGILVSRWGAYVPADAFNISTISSDSLQPGSAKEQ